MLTLLRILWPALIPLIVYASWRFWCAHKMRRGEVVTPIKGALFWTLLASAAIAVLCFFALGLAQHSRTEMNYQPSYMKDGELVRGGFSGEKAK
jgi:hypothetical protein